MMDTKANIYSLFQIPGDGSHLNLKFETNKKAEDFYFNWNGMSFEYLTKDKR